MYDRVYSTSVDAGAKEKHTLLVGGSRGSMYNVRMGRMSATFVSSFLRKRHSHLSYDHHSSSQKQTCDADSTTLGKLTNVNLAKKAATDLEYNFYNIGNPKEYLTGSDAEVVEKGPYKLR
jgi:hypothetical protein